MRNPWNQRASFFAPSGVSTIVAVSILFDGGFSNFYRWAAKRGQKAIMCAAVSFACPHWHKLGEGKIWYPCLVQESCQSYSSCSDLCQD
jgi:hypothetical protein